MRRTAKRTVSKCGNVRCNATSTPLWRKGWTDPKTGEIVMLCNACGLHYKKGHYCSYCFGIYKEIDADDMENPWIGCDRCSRWIHKGCEEKHNEGRVHEIVIDGEERKLFLCPECRDVEQAAIASGDAHTLQEFHESLQYSRRKKPGSERGRGRSRRPPKPTVRPPTTPRKTSTKTKSKTSKAKATITTTAATAGAGVSGGVRKKRVKQITENKLNLSVSTAPHPFYSRAYHPVEMSPTGGYVVLESPVGSSSPRSPFSDMSSHHSYHHVHQPYHPHHYIPQQSYAPHYGTEYYPVGAYHPARSYHHHHPYPQQTTSSYHTSSIPQSPSAANNSHSSSSSSSSSGGSSCGSHDEQHPASSVDNRLTQSDSITPSSSSLAVSSFSSAGVPTAAVPSYAYTPEAVRLPSPYSHHHHQYHRPCHHCPCHPPHAHIHDQYGVQFHMARQRMSIRIDHERLSKKYRKKFAESPKTMTKLGSLWAVCDELFSKADYASS